jgi:hypothetical protein
MSVRRLAKPNLQPEGHMVASVSAMLGLLDVAFGEVDR